MARSRKSVSNKEWLSLFEKSLHENAQLEKNELKRSREENEASPRSPASPTKTSKTAAAPAPASPPTFTRVTQPIQTQHQEDAANSLLNLATDLAISAENNAAQEAEQARQAALIALRDKLKAECIAQWNASQQQYKKGLHRIETIENIECDLIAEVIENTTPSTNNFFKAPAYTPLQLAVYDGDLNKVNELLTDPNIIVDNCYGAGLSPLWLAAYYNHVDIAKALLNHGANYDLTCARGYKNFGTPYEVAKQKNAEEIVRAIIRKEEQLFESMNTTDFQY